MAEPYDQFMDRLIAAAARLKAIEAGAVDPDSAALDSRVRTFMDSHPGTSYPEGLERVLAAQPLTSRFPS
jgi:hypothetical protein